MQDWAFLCREPILIVRFFHGMYMECWSQARLGWARSPSFQVQLRAHNFLFGSSTITRFNYANTCSLKSQALEPSLVYLRLAIRPRTQFQNSRILLYKWLVIQVTTRFAVEDFFPTSCFTQEREKLSTDELPPRGVQDSPLSIFCPTSRSSQESEGFFYRRATYRGKYGKAKEAVESATAGLLPQEGDMRKSRKEKDQGRLVYCHKKGT